VKAPAIVVYQTKAEIRTPVGGFVQQIHVHVDQLVKQGDLIGTIRNDELTADIAMLKMQILTTELRARIYQQPPRQIAAYQVETKTRESLVQRLQERLEQQVALEIRAPIAGQIIADDLEVLLGTYLAPGHKICSIGSVQSKRITALIAQHDFDMFEAKSGSDVDVHIWGEGICYFKAVLDQVYPRARVKLPHPAFGSSAGGPLAVKYSSPSTSHQTDQEAGEPFELVDPRFVAQVSLSAGTSSRLLPGQTGYISFRTARGKVGEVLYEKTANWFRRMRNQNQARWR
jgi:multidrug resistance efflux pump